MFFSKKNRPASCDAELLSKMINYAALCIVFLGFSSFAYSDADCQLIDADEEATTVCTPVVVWGQSSFDWNSWVGNLPSNAFGGTGSDSDPSNRDVKISIINDEDERTSCPVLIGSGTKIWEEKDYEDTGEMPLKIVRNYSSVTNKNLRRFIFGSRWATELDNHLSLKYSNGQVCHTEPIGTLSSGCNYVGKSQPTGIEFFSFYGKREFVLRGSEYSESITNLSNITSKIVSIGENWLYTSHEGVQYEFNKFGRLLSTTNPHGLSWKVSYENNRIKKVTHSSGRTLNFKWNLAVNNAQYVSAVTLPNGKVITYEFFDGTVVPYRNVYNVTFPDGLGKKSYLLSGGTHPQFLYQVSIDGGQWTEHKYEGGLVKTSGLLNGVETSSFSYTETSTTVTNAKGGVRTYRYDDLWPPKLIGVDKNATSVCPASASLISYFDGDMKVEFKEDWNGNRTAYTYYARAISESTYRTDNIQYEYAAGITKEYFWDNFNRLTKLQIWDGAKDPALCKPGAPCRTPRLAPSVITEYVYDNSNSPSYKNRLMYETTKALKWGSPDYTAARTTVYNYEFHDNNIVKKITLQGSPSNPSVKTVKDFNVYGDLVSLTNAKGHTHQFVYDSTSSGRVDHIIDPNGLITDFVYDGKGRLKSKSVIDGVPKITKYDYYADDQISRITFPNGGYIAYDLDEARRISSISRPDSVYTSQVTNLTYDLLSQIETEKNYYMDGTQRLLSAVNTDRTYDNYGILSQSRGQNGQIQDFTYDGNQKPLTVTDALGRVSRFTYAPSGQVETYTNPALEKITYKYDPLGNLAQIIDARGVSTYYRRNAFGEIETEINSDTGITLYEYTDQGQIDLVRRANVALVDFTYDELGRVIKLVSSGSNVETETINYSYDSCANGKGKLCGFSDSSGSTNYSYTLSGAISKQTSYVKLVRWSFSGMTLFNAPFYSEINYSYDDYGRLSTQTYSNGQVVKYGYDANNIENKVEVYANGAWSTLVSNKRFYNRDELTYGNGIVRNNIYDLDGRTTSITSEFSGSNSVGRYQGLNYKYRNSTNLVETITNTVDPSSSQTYTYDDASRLKTVVSGLGDQTFNYDQNGNRTQHIWGGQTDTYFGYATNNIYSSINKLSDANNSRSKSLFYNSIGNLSDVSLPQGGIGHKFDALNRLKSVAGTYAGSMFYMNNALNQRVYKSPHYLTGIFTTVRYLYDSKGTLLAETRPGDNSTEIGSIYIYFKGRVVGLIRDNKVYSVHNDHLGRPEVITDESRNLVWQAKNGAFDRTVALSQIGSFNLGFPGQYYDSESRLWYNLNRYYDASIGRYISSDPLGLLGGTNTYAYAENNPVGNVDPSGLLSISEQFCRTYPKSAQRIKTLDRRITSKMFGAYLIYGQANKRQVLSALFPGKGPRIKEANLFDPSLANVFGEFSPGINSDEIRLDIRNLLNRYEADTISGRFFDATVLHELTHYLDDQDQLDYPGEEGAQFEVASYGKVLNP